MGDGQAAVLEDTARNFSLGVGDAVDISYSFPLPREAGQPTLAGASQRRTTERFTVIAIVRQDGVTDAGVRTGFIVALADAQAGSNLPDRAQLLIGTVDPGLYETNNAEVAALRVREVARAIQQRLGDEYIVTPWSKPPRWTAPRKAFWPSRHSSTPMASSPWAWWACWCIPW